MNNKLSVWQNAPALPSILEDEQGLLKLYEAVGKRSSIRTFSGPPDAEGLAVLSYLCHRCSMNGVRLEMGMADENCLYRTIPFVEPIVGSGRFIAVIRDKGVQSSSLWAGFCGELLLLQAVTLNLGTCWVAGTYSKKVVDIPLNEGEELSAIIAVGIPQNEENPRPKRKKLTDICRTDPAQWPVWAYQAAECVRIAPSAINRQPWYISLRGHTLLLEKKLPCSMLDLGIALLHLLIGSGGRDYTLRIGQGSQIAMLRLNDEDEAEL